MLHTHFDQATTAQGSITLDGETFEVDCVGFRDRSWGVRSQFGPNVMGPAAYASYSWGSSRSGDHDGFFSMCGDFGNGSAVKFDTSTTTGQPLVTLEQLDV